MSGSFKQNVDIGHLEAGLVAVPRVLGEKVLGVTKAGPRKKFFVASE